MAVALYSGVVGFVNEDISSAIVYQIQRSGQAVEGYKFLHTTVPFVGVTAGSVIYYNYAAQAGDGENWIVPGDIS
ncbi:MAG TPA: hypothetical protein P5136_00380 [Methanofastidiosum sp.]|nr:hypothetical protein [Methanofastidiosum sp.]